MARDRMQASLVLYAQDERGRAARELWTASLLALAGRRDVHGLLAGRAVRLLADTGVPSPPGAGRRCPAGRRARGGRLAAAPGVPAGGAPPRRFAAHLSIGIPAAGQAAWAE